MTPKLFTITDTPGVKTSELLARCRAKFSVWSYYQDDELDQDFPPPDKTTTRYFARNLEADPDLANKSANDLEREGIPGITLRERLIMELQYFEETGDHLDSKNTTICSGSRDRRGYVPCAHWHVGHGEFYVDAYGPEDAVEDWRSRRAVSLEPSSLNPGTPALGDLPRELEINGIIYVQK